MTLLAELLDGDRRALARAISAVEDGTEQASVILAGIHPQVGRAAVVGFTGPPGAGKSTLIGGYVSALRRSGRTVAVIAVDPSSPLTGGAILGDRVRMLAHAEDDGVFIRSLAARGHLGGLSATAPLVIDLMDAAGFDVVIIETVGAGQSEVEIAELAAVTVVVCAPGLGDDVQAIKAGILEIADVLVVNKGDSPEAAVTRAQLYASQHLRSGEHRAVPILTATATTGQGIAELVAAIDAKLGEQPPRKTDSAQRIRRMLAAQAARLVRDSVLAGTDATIEAICQDLQNGRLAIAQALARLFAACAQPEPPEKTD